MKLLVLIAAALLAGCSTLGLDKKNFENRIVTTLPCDRAFVASLYGPFGLTSEIDEKDVAVLCERKK